MNPFSTSAENGLVNEAASFSTLANTWPHDRTTVLRYETIRTAISRAASNLETLLIAKPPAPILDLAVNQSGTKSASFAWTAPSNYLGQAVTAYDFRYSNQGLTEANWHEATETIHEPSPSLPNKAEVLTINNLQPDKTYYAAIRSQDRFGEISPLSNVVSFRTETPISSDEVNEIPEDPDGKIFDIER